MATINQLSSERYAELSRMYDCAIPQWEIDAAYAADMADRYGKYKGDCLMYASQARRMARTVRRYRQLAGCERYVEGYLREFRHFTECRRNANRAYWAGVHAASASMQHAAE